MLHEILPEIMINALQSVPQDCLREIRLRVGKPVIINTSLGAKYLTPQGFSDDINDVIITRKSNIEYILGKCSNNSLYTINDKLINGYVTVFGGIRVGVSGELVEDNGITQTIKNITSLNIRIPHEIKNCSLPIYNLLTTSNQVFSTLIISPPGMGKTTFLRDFAYQLSTKMPFTNQLIVDERSEITGISNGTYSFNKINADIYTNCTKKYGFINGIRSMKPDVILTDELNIDTDLEVVENAITSGVKVVATIHASSIADLKNKPAFSRVMSNKLFDRYVVLGNSDGVGTIEGVYNSNLSCIYVWLKLFA